MLFKLNKRTTEITNTIEARQILRHLGMLAERIDQAVIITDLAGGVHFANIRWALMHGYKSSAELIGKHISSFYSKQQMKNTIRGALRQTKNAGLAVASTENLRRDGTAFKTKIRMTALKEKNAKPEAILVFAEDVSKSSGLRLELKRTKKQIERLRTQIKQQNKDTAPPSRMPAGPPPAGDANEQSDPSRAALPAEQLSRLAEMAKRFA